MGIFDPDEVITIYSIREAIDHGALVEVFRRSWEWLTGGKPVVASSNVNGEISPEEMQGVWNKFVDWRKRTKPKVGEKERVFSTTVRHMTVWVIEDDMSKMILFPEDY